MVDLKLIQQLEISVVRRPENGVCDVRPNNLGNPLRNPLRNPLLDVNFREAEDVLPIGFVLDLAG